MIFGALPPAGNRIYAGTGSGELPVFPPYDTFWVQSGTAALALALRAARARHADIDGPEVILPGYACPDLVAAAEFAGVRPVLADIGSDDPGYDLASLQSALSAHTVAVVAVNFLGLRERLQAIRALLRDWPAVALVEDNAQWFPEPQVPLHGDAVCISFGRGKPVSLLGGGLALMRTGWANPQLMENSIAAAAPADPRFANKVALYNTLLHPLLYGLVSRAPGLQLGRTVFKPLSGIRALDSQRLHLVAENVRRYRLLADTSAQALLRELPTPLNLPARLSDRAGRLLRFPLLFANRARRDEAWSRLLRQGLGASAMYQRVLPEIEGVGDRVDARLPLPGARSFSERLLTLPVHAGVSESHIRQMLEIVRGVC